MLNSANGSLDATLVTADHERQDQRNDRFFHWAVLACAFFVLVALVGAALSMLWGAREAFQTFGWHFIVNTDWDAVHKKFGALVPIYGTLVTAALAMLIAVPVSFGIALFLTEIAPNWLRGPVATAVELLAGIPSIIYGMWGFFVLGPFLANYVQPLVIGSFANVPILNVIFAGPPSIVTHNMQQAARVSDKTAFMYLGELIEFDDTSKIFTSPSDRRTQDYITGRFG